MPSSENNPSTWFLLLISMARHWRLIVTFMIVAAIAGPLVAKVLPRTYQANAKLLLLRLDDTDSGNPEKKSSTYFASSASAIAGILETDECMTNINHALKTSTPHKLFSRWEGGILTITAYASDPESASVTANTAAVQVTKIAYRLHLVDDPILSATFDEANRNAPQRVLKLLEPVTASSVPSTAPNKIAITLLFTLSALCLGSLIALAYEWYKTTGKKHLKELREAIDRHVVAKG